MLAKTIDEAAYQQGRRIAGELSAALLWAIMWAFGGWLTQQALASLGGWLLARPPVPFLGTSLGDLGAWLVVPAVGWGVHILISAVEQTAWRVRAWRTLVVFGGVDVASNTAGFVAIGVAAGFDVFNPFLWVGSFGAGCLVALVPEAAITGHVFAALRAR